MPLLALMQFGGAVLLVVFFKLCGMLWITATFRSELELSTTRMLNDLSWLIFVVVFPGYVLQLSAWPSLPSWTNPPSRCGPAGWAS
ncbi:hypothetical protein A5742_04510 [Mycolicibacterium fortuitum]|uniref:Uncharacterized protein n=1 Tax=Mycolicibacterium fortuitum TaxID=1766 RepID=A0ABD6QIP1_MYCFO|nr:hypothetical protein A5742_04510 [Mycolicibacterium fortuitum]